MSAFPLPFLRRSWLLLGACGLFHLTAAPAGQAKPASDAGGTSLDVNFFYETLKDEGTWYNTTEFGDVWQPQVASKNDAWRPYTDGYWTYTDGGWMFVSNESFGWAVYHYGRWTHLKDLGWAWVPGTDWAPAWVTWRTSDPNGAPPDAAQVAATAEAAEGQNPPPTGAAPPSPDAGPPATDPRTDAPAPSHPRAAAAVSENYIGWAPLPPEPVAYGSYYSYGPTVDVDFGINPYDYCFADTRYFGAPVIGAVVFDPFRSYECCERSVNVTNIYYNREGAYRGFYNGGPDYNRVRGVSERPIPQYQLRRTASATLAQRDIRAGQFNRVQGSTLNVAAPRFSARHVNAKDGRVSFTNRGAVPVTQVSHDPAPAAAAGDPRYQRAQAAFKQQGETARARPPGAGRGGSSGQGFAAGGNRASEPGTAAAPGTRQARQGPEGETAQAANPPRTRAERRAARQAAVRESRASSSGGDSRPTPARTSRGGGGGGRRVRSSNPEAGRARSARQSAPLRGERVREAGPRAPRQSGPVRQFAPAPRGGGGGGGGGGGRGNGGGGGHKDEKKR